MGLDAITLVVPGDPTERKYFHYERLTDALRTKFAGSVSLVENAGAIPANGAVLMDRYGSTSIGRGHMTFQHVVEELQRMWRPEQRRRIVCLNVARDSETLALVEQVGLAGAVDDHDYETGMDSSRMGRDIASLSGLYGSRTAIEQIGAPIHYGNERYSKCMGQSFPSLAALLLAYLDAYWKTARPD